MSYSQCDSRQFRRACGRFPTGVTVTTLLGVDGEPLGITVSSFASVSLTPPMVLVCIDHRSQMVPHFAVERCFGINVLSEDQQELSIRFSGTWGERFRGVKWYPGYTGVPLLFDVPAVFECRVSEILPAGDHIIVIGRVLHVDSSEHSPLTYINSSYGSIIRGQPT